MFEALGADSPPDIPAAVLDRKSKVAFGNLAQTAHTRREIVRVGSAAVLATCGALITDAKGLLQAATMQLALAGSSTIHEHRGCGGGTV